MGEAMLKKEELEYIGEYVKDHMADWLREARIIPIESGLLPERIVRVEEGIKNQNDTLEKILHQMDKRFEQVDKRFEQVDKRFEQVDKRFEQVDKRFEEVRADMNHRFNQMFAYFTAGILILGTLMSVYNFVV